MCDVESIAIASGRHRHLGDVAIGNSQERLARDALCLEVEPAMEMVGTQLAEVATQEQWEVEGDSKVGCG